MTGAFTNKVYFALAVVISLGLTSSAENDLQDRSKYKYGYVISHKEGSTQAHLESRDGNLALGRYYVNLRNGTGQKVTYFADDLGFHTGVSYSSQDGKGSSKTQIAMGQKALAAFGDTDVEQNLAATAASPTLLFGNKIIKSALSTITSEPSPLPKLNYTPVPGGFFLTHDSLELSTQTTERPSYNAGFTSQPFSTGGSKQSEVDLTQSKANTETFYPTFENAKNEIRQPHIQFTTSSIKSYTLAPQQDAVFSRVGVETNQFSQGDQNIKVSTYATNVNDLSYSKEKSIEKTHFGDIDAQIISEVQKHAEQIIMKDIQKGQNLNLKNEIPQYSVGPSTVTMQPIIVTNNGESGLKSIISTTAIPEVGKSSKNLQSETINSVKISEKHSDQALEDSGYFRVSLSPSLVSSINVSQTPLQSINAESTNRNSFSNNSTLCEFNLCEKNSQQIFSVDLTEVKPSQKPEDSSSHVSDTAGSSGTSKVLRTFYPENKLHDEKHYITTIDVQKAISLDVNQNEAGTIQLAQNFPFNKIKPFEQSHTPQPLISNQISVTSGLFSSGPNLKALNTPRKPYILNTVTTAPGLFDVTPNQNLEVLQGLNDVSSSSVQYSPVVQDRAGTNRLGYENQLVVPPPPVVLTNEAAEQYRQRQEDLQQVEKSIQELRQQIISNIDEQHEEEQRKQNLVDEERKQYFENLKKVEALKNQNSYSNTANSQTDVIQATASPVSSDNKLNNVELVPQTQYVSAPELQYESIPQTQYQPVTQNQYDSVPQVPTQFETPPQTQYQTGTQTQYEPQPPPQSQYETVAQRQLETPTQTQYEPTSQEHYEITPQTQQYVQEPQTFQTEIKDFTHEVAVPQPVIQQIPDVDVYQKPVLPYNQDVQTANRQYNLYDNQNMYAIDNNIQQSAPSLTTEKIQLNNYVPQNPPIALPPRYAVLQTAQIEEKPKAVPQFGVLNGQVNTLPVGLATEVVPPAKIPDSRALLVNRVVPFDYSRLLQVKQPVSLLQAYQVPLTTDSKITLPDIYAQQVAFPVQIPQAYKFLPFPEIAPVTKQYHSTLTQKANNKVRVQPLKPSNPDEDSQREAVQNLLAQPQFQQTYYYPGLPVNNRIQLRHIRKNQISNADQVRSQSVIRRGKSLKNLRIEYGFKPPLRPSVEFSEEVKPSIYGPSVKP